MNNLIYCKRESFKAKRITSRQKEQSYRKIALLKIMLSTWFDHLEKFNFAKKFSAKGFCLAVKTKGLPTENGNEIPVYE